MTAKKLAQVRTSASKGALLDKPHDFFAWSSSDRGAVVNKKATPGKPMVPPQDTCRYCHGNLTWRLVGRKRGVRQVTRHANQHRAGNSNGDSPPPISHRAKSRMTSLGDLQGGWSKSNSTSELICENVFGADRQTY